MYSFFAFSERSREVIFWFCWYWWNCWSSLFKLFFTT